MNCFCDYERPIFYVKKIRTARKVHRCNECYSAIVPGKKYEHVSGKWDDRVGSYKTCQRCLDLRNYTTDNVPCLCFSHGNIIEDCIEALREYAHELPGLLFRGYRLKILAERQPSFESKRK